MTEPQLNHLKTLAWFVFLCGMGMAVWALVGLSLTSLVKMAVHL